MRECDTCHKQFSPSSRHKTCPSCRRAIEFKNKCVCGKPKCRESESCQSCANIRQTGEGNARWKGGVTYHKAGYVMVRFGRTYIFEHILVIEKHLGRKLLEGENVHHKNGTRDDNRLENLELWTRPQPSGIRAKDALAWAREIVERYEGIV